MDNRNSTPSKDDILAILKAHRELGPEFDTHLADQLLDLLGHRSDRSAASNRSFENFKSRRQRPHKSRVLPIMVLSIPILLIAAHTDGTTGLFAVLGFDALIILFTLIFGG